MKRTSSVAPLRVRLMGVTIELDAPDEATRARLAHQWSRALVEDDGPGVAAIASIRVGEAISGDEHGRDYQLASQVTRQALEATAGQRFNLHAGGLADEHGRVLALVGPSGSGKTTASRVLARRLGYLSDETVSIGPGRQVWAHPKPLSVIVDPGRPRHKEQLSPDDLGLLPAPATGVLERLVVLHRPAGTTRGLVRLDTITAMLELIAQSSSLPELPDPLQTLLELIRDCGVWALEYDEIEEHLDDLVRLLADQQPPADAAETEPRRHPGDQDIRMDEIAPHLVSRLSWVDALELGDDLVVLLGARALHVSDVGAAVWLELDVPRTLDELVDGVRRRHGDHPDARTIIEKAIAMLVGESVVAWGRLE